MLETGTRPFQAACAALLVVLGGRPGPATDRREERMPPGAGIIWGLQRLTHKAGLGVETGVARSSTSHQARTRSGTWRSATSSPASGTCSCSSANPMAAVRRSTSSSAAMQTIIGSFSGVSHLRHTLLGNTSRSMWLTCRRQMRWKPVTEGQLLCVVEARLTLQATPTPRRRRSGCRRHRIAFSEASPARGTARS
jgi:hypothetical protein